MRLNIAAARPEFPNNAVNPRAADWKLISPLEYLSIFPLVYLNGLVRYSVTGVIFLGLLIMINTLKL